MRLRSDNIFGTLSATCTSGASSFSAANLADLPTLASGDDYYPVILDPNGTNNGPEIAYITVHTASATSATIVRGKETTGDVTHDSGDFFVIGPTALDMITSRVFNNIDFPKHTADTPDDEFTGDTLDGKWSVTTGTQGATDITSTAATNAYEIRDGKLFFQVNASNSIFLRQDYTLPQNTTLVAKIGWAGLCPDPSGMNNAHRVMVMAANDADDSLQTNNKLRLQAYTGGDIGYTAISDNGGVNADTWAHMHGSGGAMYFRLMRDGDLWWGAFSNNGTTWLTLDEGHSSTLYDNIWIGCYGNTTETGPVPVTWVEWIRQGGVDIHPW